MGKRLSQLTEITTPLNKNVYLLVDADGYVQSYKVQLKDVPLLLFNTDGLVEEVPGMGLSQNSFTNAEKQKLQGIETGAQVNAPVDLSYNPLSSNAQSGTAVAQAVAYTVESRSGAELNNFTNVQTGRIYQCSSNKEKDDSVTIVDIFGNSSDHFEKGFFYEWQSNQTYFMIQAQPLQEIPSNYVELVSGEWLSDTDAGAFQGKIVQCEDSGNGYTQGYFYISAQSGGGWAWQQRNVQPGGGGGTVDQTYNPNSTNAQSGTAVAQAVDPCATKVSGATSGNFAGLDSNGNLTDSGKSPSDFLNQIFSYGMPQGDRWTIYGIKSGVTSPTFLNIPKYIDGIATAIIREDAFEDNTTITSVFIPSTITQINRGAFFGCAYIEDVYYEGSETDWGNIIVGTDNEDLTGATFHYNQENATVEYVNSGLSAKENVSNKVSSISSVSTDVQYPSAKCVYDIVGDIESALITLRGGNNS